MMMMMTKKRMEKTSQGRNEEKRRIIVSSGMPMAKNDVEKGMMILRMRMVNDIENGNEE